MTSSYAQALALATLGALAAVTIAVVVGAASMFRSSWNLRQSVQKAAAALTKVTGKYQDERFPVAGEEIATLSANAAWRSLTSRERLRLRLLLIQHVPLRKAWQMAELAPGTQERLEIRLAQQLRLPRRLIRLALTIPLQPAPEFQPPVNREDFVAAQTILLGAPAELLQWAASEEGPKEVRKNMAGALELLEEERRVQAALEIADEMTASIGPPP